MDFNDPFDDFEVDSYDDLVIAGEASIYSGGITAGRLHLLENTQEATKEREILIYQALPDELPACRAIMSTVPQTPLAHLLISS